MSRRADQLQLIIEDLSGQYGVQDPVVAYLQNELASMQARQQEVAAKHRSARKQALFTSPAKTRYRTATREIN